LKQSTSEPIRRKFDEVIFKEMRPGREVILLTPRYYVFSLRGEQEILKQDIIDGFF
jgi:hypothetical protein